MSIDLFVFRKNTDISAAELREACDGVRARFPYILIDTAWEAKDDLSFPSSDTFFFSVCRGSLRLALPGQSEDFEVDGESQERYAYAHLNANSRAFNFLLFIADALASQLNAEIFDPQDGSVLPPGLLPLEQLKEQHEAEMRSLNPFMGKEYRWYFSFSGNASADFNENAARFGTDVTASVKAVLDDSFGGFEVTRFTSEDLPGRLKLHAMFTGDDELTIRLIGDAAHSEQFDRFAEDLSRRFGQKHRSRARYVFP